jgi:uncharacterized phiE125 gp8 family phage protein
MKRMLLAGPAVEPVLLAEAKAHLRLDDDAEDDLLDAMIGAARLAVETEIRRVLITQSWRAVFATWPQAGVILPVRPVLDVDEVRALDRDGTATVLGESDVQFDAATGSVRLFAFVPDAVGYEIDFKAGYGPSGEDVPQPLRQAIRLLVTHWYEHRAAVSSGETLGAAPFGYRDLVAPYRRLALC